MVTTGLSVMFTPDHAVLLREQFVGREERIIEGKFKAGQGQMYCSRAGLAMGRHAGKTVLVQIGKARPLLRRCSEPRR
jgi:hypothetical protein